LNLGLDFSSELIFGFNLGQLSIEINRIDFFFNHFKKIDLFSCTDLQEKNVLEMLIAPERFEFGTFKKVL